MRFSELAFKVQEKYRVKLSPKLAHDLRRIGVLSGIKKVGGWCQYRAANVTEVGRYLRSGKSRLSKEGK